MTLIKLSHHGRNFLNGGYHHPPFPTGQSLNQILAGIGLINVNGIILSIGEKARGCLVIQILAVNDKNRLINGRDSQEVSGYLIGSQGLA